MITDNVGQKRALITEARLVKFYQTLIDWARDAGYPISWIQKEKGEGLILFYTSPHRRASSGSLGRVVFVNTFRMPKDISVVREMVFTPMPGGGIRMAKNRKKRGKWVELNDETRKEVLRWLIQGL